MVDLSSAQRELQQLETAVSSGNVDQASKVLSKLKARARSGVMKLELIRLPALAPVPQPSPSASEELLLARGVHEQAVLLALLRADLPAFQRGWSQLAPFYAAPALAAQLPPSPLQPHLTALNLLRLLSSAAVAEFHAELELISDEIKASPEVAEVAELEAWLMEGAYHRVLAARDSLSSSPHASFFLARLADTVREEVAACTEHAYVSLDIPAALQLFRLDGEAALATLAAQHGWTLAEGRVEFGKGQGGAAVGVASQDIISNCMLYAKELERIV